MGQQCIRCQAGVTRNSTILRYQITLLTGKSLGLLVSGPVSAIARDGLFAHAWVVPPSVSIDPVRVEASKFVYRPPGCDPPRAPVPAKMPVQALSDLCVPDSRVGLGVCGTMFYPMGLVNYESHHVAKNSPGGAGGRCSAKDHRIKLAQKGTLWYRRYKSMPRSSKFGPKIIG